MSTDTAGALVTHRGGCHCRRVRFEVQAPARLKVQDCNCSICRMSGFLHLIVPAARFRLLSGADVLAEYTFNTGVAKHRFCRVCGIKSFYIPRSNPDGVDVNVRCLDEGSVSALEIEPFDGQHWERHGAALAQLSR
ncbi:MAG: GFA family protein [Arenimonas sp.]